MEPIVLRNSLWKNVLYGLLTLLFVAGGVFILAVGRGWRATLVGAACVVFFGAGLLIFLRQIFDTRPRVVIDDAGIFDRTLGVGVIEWGDVRQASMDSILGNHFISLVLRDPEKYLQRTSKPKARLAKYNRALGFETINVNLSGVDRPAKEIFDIVVRRITANKVNDFESPETHDNRH